MNMKNFASDLQRKGELGKIEKMDQLSKKIERESNNGLSGAYLTNGIHGEYDTIAMIANSKEYEDKQGYILFDNVNNKAVFVSEKELND